MQTIIHHAEDRGKGDYDWLSTRYSFSFANWYNPARMGFGALIVINDDTIAPGAGFGAHSHNNMEIITLVTSGTLAHKDSLGNTGTIRAGEVQVMSAGTGVTHSEFNASSTEPLSLFQIWILPNARGVEARYDQRTFAVPQAGERVALVGPIDNADALGIHQNAHITRIAVDAEKPVTYSIQSEGNGVYAFVISGTATIATVALRERDALGITETESFEITSDAPADILLIEVPMDIGR